MIESEKKEIFEDVDIRDPSKKPYKTPELTIYGDVAEITQLLVKGSADGITGGLLSG